MGDKPKWTDCGPCVNRCSGHSPCREENRDREGVCKGFEREPDRLTDEQRRAYVAEVLKQYNEQLKHNRECLDGIGLKLLELEKADYDRACGLVELGRKLRELSEEVRQHRAAAADRAAGGLDAVFAEFRAELVEAIKPTDGPKMTEERAMQLIERLAMTGLRPVIRYEDATVDLVAATHAAYRYAVTMKAQLAIKPIGPLEHLADAEQWTEKSAREYVFPDGYTASDDGSGWAKKP